MLARMVLAAQVHDAAGSGMESVEKRTVAAGARPFGGVAMFVVVGVTSAVVSATISWVVQPASNEPEATELVDGDSRPDPTAESVAALERPYDPTTPQRFLPIQRSSEARPAESYTPGNTHPPVPSYERSRLTREAYDEILGNGVPDDAYGAELTAELVQRAAEFPDVDFDVESIQCIDMMCRVVVTQPDTADAGRWLRYLTTHHFWPREMRNTSQNQHENRTQDGRLITSVYLSRENHRLPELDL